MKEGETNMGRSCPADGESMFSSLKDASKIVLAQLSSYLEDSEFALIDAQVCSPHLQRLGSVELPRGEFLALLAKHCNVATDDAMWRSGTSI